MTGLFMGAAHAELADKDKPMNIEADALRYEDTRQASVFTGNVLVTKGTIIMRGAKMDVRQDPQGNQFGVLTGTSDAPGFFRQKREGLDEWIEGEGERIEYDSKNQTVVLSGSAALRRYRGTQLNDESLGNQITYNSLTEVFTVKGGPNARTAANPSGRVRAMLTPIPEEERSGQTVAPSQADPAKLRSTPALNEKKQ
jgi:lipopolysaccharide export system protein LptA